MSLKGENDPAPNSKLRGVKRTVRTGVLFVRKTRRGKGCDELTGPANREEDEDREAEVVVHRSEGAERRDSH